MLWFVFYSKSSEEGWVFISPLKRAQFYKSSEQGSVCVSPLTRARYMCKSSEEGSVVFVVHAGYRASCCFACTCSFQRAGYMLARLLRSS